MNEKILDDFANAAVRTTRLQDMLFEAERRVTNLRRRHDEAGRELMRLRSQLLGPQKVREKKITVKVQSKNMKVKPGTRLRDVIDLGTGDDSRPLHVG